MRTCRYRLMFRPLNHLSAEDRGLLYVVLLSCKLLYTLLEYIDKLCARHDTIIHNSVDKRILVDAHSRHPL